jgi:hypothetical protein
MRSNIVWAWICVVLGALAFGAIDYATSSGVLFFAALSVTFFVTAVTFYHTERIESRIRSLETRLFGEGEVSD